MQIIEIYKSIQGESTYAGVACVFVRLMGCNLRCTWCDSEYTFSGGHRMSLPEVSAEVARLSPGGGLVEITGGHYEATLGVLVTKWPKSETFVSNLTSTMLSRMVSSTSKSV